jgi:hypothetical protein
MGWLCFRGATEAFFAWNSLDACRNVKINESFLYQNTFITKITNWMNYKSLTMWVTKWSCWILGTFRLALGGLIALRVYIHLLCRPTSRRNSRLARHTRCLRFTAISYLSHSFRRRGLSLVRFFRLCSIRSSPFPLLLAHLALVFGLHCPICVFLSIFKFCCL